MQHYALLKPLDSMIDSRGQALIEVLSESLCHQEDVKYRLSLLPISSLADLRWLSEQTDNPELQALVTKLAGT